LRIADGPLDRGEIDDGAALLGRIRLHREYRVLRAEKHAVEIDAHEPAPLLQRLLLRGRSGGDARIVEETVSARKRARERREVSRDQLEFVWQITL